MSFDRHEELKIEQEQKQRKDKEKEEGFKVPCRGCRREIFPNMRCDCPPGGGSSGGTENGEEHGKNNTSTLESRQNSSEANQLVPQLASVVTEAKDEKLSLSEEQLRNRFERLADLVKLDAIEIKNDKDTLTLTIRALIPLNDVDKKILFDCMNAIRKEYCIFARDNGLTLKEDPIKGNALRITVNGPKSREELGQLYDRFIQQLIDKKLWPETGLQEKKEQESEHAAQTPEKSNYKSPCPYPKGAKKLM